MTAKNDIEVMSLADSLDPLIDHFNGEQDKLRFVAILSPMCPQ